MLAREETGAYDVEKDAIDVSHWQQDFVLIFWKHMKIAILENMLINQFEEAYSRKKLKYAPI